LPIFRAPGESASTSCWRTSTVSRASGIANWVSSSVTWAPSAFAAVTRALVSSEAAADKSARSPVASVRSRSIRPSVSSRSSSRAADCSAQASTSAMVSPYLRVSAVSDARRSDTAAIRAGSDSRREA
jgi:hypothetical protein